MATEELVPAPLGWCSPCLGVGDVQTPAVTLFDGGALCTVHNAQVHHNLAALRKARDEGQQRIAEVVAGGHL